MVLMFCWIFLPTAHLSLLDLVFPHLGVFARYSVAEVMGKALVENFISTEFRSSVKKVLDNALRGVETASFEFPLFTKTSARRVDLLLNANPRRDSTGRIVGVVGVGQVCGRSPYPVPAP
jgi:hypothetical protein